MKNPNGKDCCSRLPPRSQRREFGLIKWKRKKERGKESIRAWLVIIATRRHGTKSARGEKGKGGGGGGGGKIAWPCTIFAQMPPENREVQCLTKGRGGRKKEKEGKGRTIKVTG